MTDIPQNYLDLVRKVFEKRYARALTDVEVENIAQNLLNFGKVILEFYLKKQELYGEKFEIWLKEEIISRSNPEDISEMTISNGSNQGKKKK